MESQKELKITRPLMLSAFAAALAGLLFGFDTAVIAGVAPALEKIYALDAWGKASLFLSRFLARCWGRWARRCPPTKSAGATPLK